MKSFVVFALCLAFSAAAQEARPSLVSLPLELDPAPPLMKQKPALLKTFGEAVDQSGVLLALPGEVTAAVKAVKRDDFQVNDESVALVAKQTSSLYALSSALHYALDGEMTLAGRLIRDDGKVMGTAAVKKKRGKDQVLTVFNAMLPEYFAALKLNELPATKAVAGAPVEVKVAPVKVEPAPAVIAAVPVPKAPPPPGLARVSSYVLMGVGGALAIGGVVAFATTPPVEFEGRVVKSDPIKALQSENQQTVGVGLMIGGAGLAAAGAVLFALSPSPVQVSVAPMQQGGALVTVGGALP